MKIQRLNLLVLIMGFTFMISPPSNAELKESGWSSDTRTKLGSVIAAEAHKNRVVVFDLDNTLLANDIGEATFAQLVHDKILTKKSVPTHLQFSFPDDKKQVNLASSPNLLAYYDSLMHLSDHHSSDQSRDITTFDWLAQIMAGLSPNQVIESSKKAYDNGSSSLISVLPGNNQIRRPHFQPQMVELVGQFLQNGYDVWVVSASNVWTVRYLVIQELNQKIRALGVERQIGGDHVIGLSVLLKGNDGRYYKDPNLAKENSRYAQLDPQELAKYRLSDHTLGPISGYFGKVANIMQYIGKVPYFVAGDSASDLSMLEYGENRLWIAHLEKAHHQRRVAEAIKNSKSPSTWLIQPVLSTKAAGFVANPADLGVKLGTNLSSVALGLEALSQTQNFRYFAVR